MKKTQKQIFVVSERECIMIKGGYIPFLAEKSLEYVPKNYITNYIKKYGKDYCITVCQ